MPHKQYMHRPTVMKDIKIIVAINLILFILYTQIDVVEWLYLFSRQHESLEIDELFALGISIALSFLIFSYRRIKELGLMAQTLEQMSLLDPLSGLPNRRAGQISLISWCELADKKNQYFSVYQIDLDQFKKVNDMYGQTIGDEVLKHVAQCLINVTPPSGKLCRWLDDNFIVIVSLKDINSPNEYAYTLQNSINNKVMKSTINLTCSIGYSVWSESQNVESILHEADDALMHAKHEGGNKIYGSL